MSKKGKVMKKDSSNKGMSKKAKVAIVVGCVVFFSGAALAMNKISASMMESVQSVQENVAKSGLFEVTKADVKQEITTSGTVIAVERKAYTSPITAKVDKVAVKVGQSVKKGDVLLTYDESELGDNLDKVKLQVSSEKAANNESYEQANKAASKVSTAKSKINTLEREIKEVKKDISKLEDQVAEYEEKLKANGKVNEKAYKKATKNLASKNETLASKQADLESQKAIVSANEDVTVSSSMKNQIAAANQLADMNVSEAQESLDKAKAGLTAKSNGIIESVEIIEGSYANETQTLFTVIDTDKIGVEFTISKDDLGSVCAGQKVRVNIAGNDYDGTVDYVSRVATVDELNPNAGSTVRGRVILDQPDDNIYIGVSAKVYVFVGEEKDSVVIPYAALNTDVDGDFVYIVNDENKVERRAVTVGIVSDEYYQVIDGVEVGDQVIESVDESVKEGEEYAPTPDLSGLAG